MSQYVPTYDSFDPSLVERYVPTSRIGVSSSVYLPGSDLDMRTGRLKPDRQQRHRTQAKMLEKEQREREEKEISAALNRELQKGGVRISLRLGILLVAIAVFFCAICLLVQQGMIVEKQKAVNRQERSITDYKSANELLETQIAEASDAATICYAASRDLNMIPAESAEAIHLVAVDTRPRNNTQPANQRQVVVANQDATAESTHVPVIADSMR